MRRIALAVAALLAFAACTGDDGVDASATTASTTETTAPPVTEAPSSTLAPPSLDPSDLGYRWAVGDCIALDSLDELPYEPYGSGGVVGCDRDHILEVVATDTFTEGSDVPFDDEKVSVTVREMCAGGFIDYVGTSQLVSGLDVVLYLPDAREWASGLRYMTCVVYDPRSGSDTPTVTGSFRGAGDSIPFTAVAGDCSNALVMRGPVLDCSIPHLYEHVGVFAPAGEDWPGDEELDDRASVGCRALVDGYVSRGASSVPGAIIGIPVTVPTRTDWEAGFRDVVCVAAAVDPSGEGLVVIGSFTVPGWTIVEAAQAA